MGYVFVQFNKTGTGEMITPVAVAFCLSALLVYAVLRLSRKYSWYDGIDERKIHTGQVPRLGGIGFASAAILVVFIFGYLLPGEGNTEAFNIRFIPVLFAMPLILVFGIVDDFTPLRPRYKLLVQVIAALLVVVPDFTFHRLSIPSLGLSLNLHWARYLLTFLWIVGITNAVNLIDGMDGLAGGVATLAALSFALMYASVNNQMAIFLCLVISASVLGFLVFNWPLPKARIFMGDGGSQFLGFMLALLPLLDDGNGRASISLPYAGAILLIPIVDTFAAIWRRVREGRRIDSPDKAHMHHKLLNLGLSVRQALLLVYALQMGISTFAVLAFRHRGPWVELLLLLSYLIAAVFFTILHFKNRGANRKAQVAAASVSAS